MLHCKTVHDGTLCARGILSNVLEKNLSDSCCSSLTARAPFCLPHFFTSAADAAWTSVALGALNKHIPLEYLRWQTKVAPATPTSTTLSLRCLAHTLSAVVCLHGHLHEVSLPDSLKCPQRSRSGPMCGHSPAQLQRIFHGQAGALKTFTSGFGFNMQSTQPLLPIYPAAGATLPGREDINVVQSFTLSNLKDR